METMETKAVSASGVFAAPDFQKNDVQRPDERPGEPLTADRVISVLASFIAGWLFIRLFWDDQSMWALPVLGAVLTGWELREAHGRGCSREHFLWLGLMWGCIFHAVFFSRAPLFFGVHVWDNACAPVFFAIPVAAYWVFSRSGLPAEGHSGRWLPLDAVRALIILPFSGFLDRLHLIGTGVRQLIHMMRSGLLRRIALGLASFGLAVLFLLLILPSLYRADAGFASLMDTAGAWISLPRMSDGGMIRFLLSLPVGAYLFGLVNRCASADRAALDEKRSIAGAKLLLLRRLPAAGQCVMLGLFAAIYCLFFYVQSGSLLTALRDRLAPGSLSMSQYAVNGFFDLCTVMALTLILVLVTVLTSDRPMNAYRPGRVLLTVLLAQCLVFAASAGAKLYLYVRCFGFTPLRLQAAWAILVMSAAAVCAMHQLRTGRETAPFWCRFAGATLLATLLI